VLRRSLFHIYFTYRALHVRNLTAESQNPCKREAINQGASSSSRSFIHVQALLLGSRSEWHSQLPL
jgi:hypothetical protein